MWQSQGDKSKISSLLMKRGKWQTQSLGNVYVIYIGLGLKGKKPRGLLGSCLQILEPKRLTTSHEC